MTYRSIGCTEQQGARRVDALAILLFRESNRLSPDIVKIDTQYGSVISAAMKRPEFTKARGDVICLYTDGKKGKVSRIFVVGLGGREEFGHGQSLRIAGSQLVRHAYKSRVRCLRLEPANTLEGLFGPEEAGRALAAGLSIGNFQFDDFKGTVSKSRKRRHSTISLTVQATGAMRRGIDQGLRIGQSLNLARSLAATPPNVASPAYLVSFCRRMAKQVGLRCTVIDAKRASQLGMGGLLAVGGASSSKPAIICLEWQGMRSQRSASKRRQPIMLVGKAITFDTGGYSIKSTSGMENMKYDKCGGVVVAATMHAIARLRIKDHVVALIPTAENMIDERGYRPGDIVRMCNGVTVEVKNTDAEGRLVLGDALAYGCDRYKPRAVIDLATLTGGVVIALGTSCAGAFFSDSVLRSHLINVAEQTGEYLWELPLWEDHKKLLKSDHADIVNSGGREASPIQGAAFLSYFVDPDIPWAHLDIAGVSDVKREGDWHGKGPTGFGVRLLVRAIESWS